MIKSKILANYYLLGVKLSLVSNCPPPLVGVKLSYYAWWCQIVLGVKSSSLPSWCQIVLLAIMVSNCPKCQIVLGSFHSAILISQTPSLFCFGAISWCMKSLIFRKLVRCWTAEADKMHRTNPRELINKRLPYVLKTNAFVLYSFVILCEIWHQIYIQIASMHIREELCDIYESLEYKEVYIQTYTSWWSYFTTNKFSVKSFSLHKFFTN